MKIHKRLIDLHSSSEIVKQIVSVLSSHMHALVLIMCKDVHFTGAWCRG